MVVSSSVLTLCVTVFPKDGYMRSIFPFSINQWISVYLPMICVSLYVSIAYRYQYLPIYEYRQMDRQDGWQIPCYSLKAD